MAKSAIGKINDQTTGWSFEGIYDPDTGFSLSDVSHDVHDFAPSLRVERIAFACLNAYNARGPDTIQSFGLGSLKQTAKPTMYRSDGRVH